MTDPSGHGREGLGTRAEHRHDSRGEAAQGGEREAEGASQQRGGGTGEDQDPGADAAQAVGHRREREADGMTDPSGHGREGLGTRAEHVCTRSRRPSQRRYDGPDGHPG